jgi:TrmH family RNA methyltransferase
VRATDVTAPSSPDDERPKSSAASPSPSESTVVDSLLHPWAVTIRRLLNRSDRLELGRIIIDDEENIDQALRARVELQALFYAGDETISNDLRARLAPDLPVHEVAKRTCKKLFENDKISRVFAIARTPPPLGLSALAAVTQDYVVLEDVSISGNVGAILRTSLALGAGGVVLLNAHPADVYDRRLIRSSRGYLFAFPVITASADEFVAYCKASGDRLLVTTPHTEVKIDEIADFDGRLAIVFGSEKEGCSPALLEAADLRVKIPTDPRVESLNVAATAAITLFMRTKANTSKRRDKRAPAPAR